MVMKQTGPLQSPSPIQYFFQGIQKLTMDSVVGDLPSYKVSVSPEALGFQIASMLEKDVHLPGVIVMEGEDIKGIVSRERFYERAGKLFGTDIYFGRSISTMLASIPQDNLILQDSTLITLATQQVLNRDLPSIYDPIIVERSGRNFRLLSALMLFIAQSHQLLELHHQRCYTVDAGQQFSDRDAILQFIRHVGIRPEFNLNVFIKPHAIRCDHCHKMVNFSVVDVVRSFPQLNRGVIVEEKMGTRSYRLYIRHRCLHGEIWEIPLFLDENLQYRSQRSARAVESYV